MARKIDYQRQTPNIWFPNQQEPDPKDRQAFRAYWQRERQRIRDGFYLADGEVYISGWLYWHTVYWVIELDKKQANGRSFKEKGTPVFRDIEWEVANDLLRAEREQKLYCLVGSRGFGKSNICASVTGHIYNFFTDTESVISGGFANDIKLLADKIDLGLSNCHPIWHQQRLLNNWKYEVRAGWKDSETGLNKGSNSRISVRNYEEGVNTMAANGTRPKVHIIDEIGKIPNLANCVLDTVPCWMNEDGMFSIPILAGTGGDMEKGADAAKIFRNPAVYNVLEFDDTWEGSGKIGKFVPVTKALNQYKYFMPLSEYLGIDHPDLEAVMIKVSNEAEVLEKYVAPRREKALRSTTSNEIIKEKAYYPLTPSESFLVISANDFPVEACQKHKQYLANNDIRPLRIELFQDLDGRITHKYTDHLPVTEFPVQNSTDKTGVIEIVEHPINDAPFGLYVAGVDPYKQSESDYSDSLGSVYIFKRMTDNMTETYQYMPVAWYTGRPKSIHTWYDTVRNLLKWYNAVAMVENADYGFIQYMIEKNETMYLAEGQSFLREISPTSKHKSTYGLPPTVAMINHWLNTSVIYCKEELEKERNDQGQVTRTALGLTRILDPMLLDEMTKFNKNAGNYDRIRAFGIALAYAKQLDALVPKVKITQQKEDVVKVIRSPFSMNRLPGKGTSSRSPFLGSRR
ncbi:MAG: hypothetical protein E6R03_17705 [Hyphomicrobiaceae bacterium]|nr:MAG: hypothetical protein E6R03_17705 [Hyphomicrobiaceae bacterium]